MIMILFRAISIAEWCDICNFGGLRGKPERGTYESKLFASSSVDAARFGRDNFQLDSEPFHLIEVKVPEALTEQLEYLILDAKSAINVSREVLPELNKHALIQKLPLIPLD